MSAPPAIVAPPPPLLIADVSSAPPPTGKVQHRRSVNKIFLHLQIDGTKDMQSVYSDITAALDKHVGAKIEAMQEAATA